jgi:hypothetical protein
VFKFNEIVEVVPKAYGVLGFIRFLKGYYLILITDRKKIAKIGKHSIYKIKDFEMIPLFKTIKAEFKEDEKKYIQIFKEI